MVYLLIICLLYPWILTAGNCCCGGIKNICIEAHLYHNEQKEPLSIDHNEYKIMKEGTFKIINNQTTTELPVISENRITIDNVSYDPIKWQALIKYKVRIGMGKVPEVRFATLQWYTSWNTKSEKIRWDEKFYIIFESKKIASP